MDLNQFLLALRARRKVFVMALLATIVTAVAVALIMPKKYVAQTTLVVDARDEQAITPARAVSISARVAYLATQLELIQSGRVATQVARDLKLAQRPELREAFEKDTGGVGPIDAWIGAELLQKLKVLSSASNLITVEFSWSDPKFAADVANGFAQAYLGVSLELRNRPTREAAEWFDEQLNGMRKRIVQAQNTLTAYQKKKGIVAADERLDIESARLSGIATQLLAARNTTYEAQARHKQAAELVASGGSPDALPEVMSSPAIIAVKADLARAESLLQTASADLGPNHPVYQRHAAEVQALRDKLTNEMKKVVATLGNAMQQSQKREVELQAALDAQQASIMQAKDVRVELAAMTRDVDNAQRTYDAVLARSMTTRIESRAKQGDVALLTPAIEPATPAHPKVPLIAGLSVVLGLMLAAMMVYALETLDRRVRSRSDLESRLAVPSLGRLSRWQPMGGRLLPAPIPSARALPHPW
ncbi:MAG TPA: chain length determinant protein EpsF [Burkholderiales bacterium]|nr:chain length determinant protein EpsF [Burkholderiales bacterium]